MRRGGGAAVVVVLVVVGSGRADGSGWAWGGPTDRVGGGLCRVGQGGKGAGLGVVASI